MFTLITFFIVFNVKYCIKKNKNLIKQDISKFLFFFKFLKIYLKDLVSSFNSETYLLYLKLTELLI